MELSQQEFQTLIERLDSLNEKVSTLKALKPEEIIYDNADVLKILKVSRRTLQSWRTEGLISVSQVGSKLYYTQKDLNILFRSIIKKASHSRMIDYVKIQLSVNADLLITDLIKAGYEIGGHWDRATGVINDYPLTAWNDTLEIKFKSAGFIELSGSLHKFSHQGINHSDFTFRELISTILSLCQKLHLNPHTSLMRNVEFGVNVQPPFVTKPFLSHVVCYVSTMFTEMTSKTGVSLGIECQLSHHRIKMYCKKSQYDLSQETMRFEIHVEKMHYLHEKHIPIKTLADLADPAMLHKLSELLLKVFNEIVIIDKSVDNAKLTASEKKIYETWLNPIDIKMLRDNNTSQFQYQRRCLKKIQKKYSTEKKQQVIAHLIEEKLNTLLQTDQQALTILTNFQNRYPAIYFNDSYQLSKVPKNPVFNESYHSNKRQIH